MGIASIGELTAIAVYLSLVDLATTVLFWAVISCISVQPAVYYLFAVYFAFFARTYPHFFEKTLNVIYLYSLYIECMLIKRDPKSSADQFDFDGMVEMSGNHRKQMVVFHVLTVSLPVCGLYVYNSTRGGFGVVDWVCTGAIAGAAVTYIAYLLTGAGRLALSWRRNPERLSFRDSRLMSL